ncbi:MAG: hypothetical protein HGN29_04450 [Asgard group archaeon]|nr:hypothetical protein [Asgard group archaeon]
MRAKIRKSPISFGFFFIFFTVITAQSSFAQLEQDAANSIQNAQEKLIEVIILLEESETKKIEIKDLVVRADSARNLIKEASDKYLEGDYDSALQKANSATEQLDQLIEEITETAGSSKQKSRLIFSLLGSISALVSVALVFIFFKKIYPWYKTKQLEEYGKLVIVYEETSKAVKDDRE